MAARIGDLRLLARKKWKALTGLLRLLCPEFLYRARKEPGYDKPTKAVGIQVLLTEATSFLDHAISTSLLARERVSMVHRVTMPEARPVRYLHLERSRSTLRPSIT